MPINWGFIYVCDYSDYFDKYRAIKNDRLPLRLAGVDLR